MASREAIAAPAKPHDATGSPAALEVRHLQTHFALSTGIAKAVDDVSFRVGRGETLCIVGESGSGKSVTALSIMRLLASPPGRAAGGQVMFGGRDLLKLSEAEMRRIRGNEISMIFQEPMSSLNPVLSIGYQVCEVVRRHQGLAKKEGWEKAVEMLRLVRIPEPERRAREYPHQLSGGMRQRAMIAIALACNPKVVIADEPTTALDVTIQAQILELISDLQAQLGTAVILITHDLGVVAETADHVIVMYAGRKVEEAPVSELFRNPRHPYTHGLMRSVPRIGTSANSLGVGASLVEIPGTVPTLTDLPPGCAFAPRCPFADEKCHSEAPSYLRQGESHWSACWHSERLGEVKA